MSGEIAADPLEATVRSIFNAHADRLQKGLGGRPGIEGYADGFEYLQSLLKPFPLDNRPPIVPNWNSELQPYFKSIFSNRLIAPLFEWYLQEVRAHQWMIGDEIIASMNEYEDTGDLDIVNKMLWRVGEWWDAWGTYVSLFNPYLEGSAGYRRTCSIHLNQTLPSSFSRAFRELILSTLPSYDPDAPLPDPDRSQVIFANLANLGLLSDYEHLMGMTLKEFTTGYVKETCGKVWNRQVWNETREWFTRTIQPWVEMAYTRTWMKTDAADSRAVVETVSVRYLWQMCEALAQLRISEIFDIIVDYPDSTPALNDLKECMFQTGTRRDLVDTLRALTKKRLLHPGADTKDILTQYVSTIRDRPDTIRTIVQHLIEPKSELIGEDNEEIKSLQDTSVLTDDYGDFTWMPEPADADAAFRSTRQTDIISTLVSIYDSKDIFVKELQILLGKRLLEIKDQNYDAEIRNLEILKLRFGDVALQGCDVMMKDITDSRRSDTQIHNLRLSQGGLAFQNPLPMHTTIISRLFWPPVQRSSLVMPGQFKKMQEDYAKSFSVTKPDRKIRFMSNVGSISLNLELSDRTVSLTDVTPLQAAIIELFSTKDIWSADDLAKELGGVDAPSVDKALEYWMDHGVLKSVGPKQYELLEVAEEHKPSGSRPIRRTVEESPGRTAEVEDQEAEQMRVYWQFIQGMLTNFGTLPTDRIHNMLKFSQTYNKTREQLAAFLDALKREGLVDFRDGTWRLVK
ncbi:hypothetical protein FRB90_010080 [Tulasnella sp. 427]|nr:hypothetical protein FRB90_010080 [Tulasnella sp. 427]